MNREQLEESAKQYDLFNFNPDEAKEEKRGFKADELCSINSVWHDTREIPKEGEHIVIATESGNFSSWYVAPDIMQVFDKFNVKLWARSSDLLPDGKEESK